MPKSRREQPVRYYDENGEPHDGIAVERNGHLTWVEDAETGKGEWLAPFEMDRY